MPKELKPKTDQGALMVYQIRIKGHLSSEWSGWFEGLSISLEENGETVLTGAVPDQAALYGLLRKIRDLGTPLISVNLIASDQADTANGTIS